MRAIATIKLQIEYKRVMLYQIENGVYLFLYQTEEDGDCSIDLWFEKIDEAKEYCQSEYNIDERDWKTINDPLPGCQYDWIQPVRVKGRAENKPKWGSYEILKGGIWVDYP